MHGSLKPSRLGDWFFGMEHGSQLRSVPVPLFPKFHEELTKSWTVRFLARINSSSLSILTNLDGRVDRGYVEKSHVKSVDVGHLPAKFYHLNKLSMSLGQSL